MIRQLLGLPLVAALTLFGPSATPQNPTGPSATFTSNSELVLVPVHVTDHYGRPLHGLTRNDFILKSDGSPERIALFDEVQAPPPSAPAVLQTTQTTAAAEKKFSNLPTEAMPQQLYIVALDTVNTPILMQSWARDQLIRYLQAHPPNGPVELVGITPLGLRRVRAFSSDSASLVQSLKSFQFNVTAQDTREVLLSHMDAKSGQIDTYGALIDAQREIQLNQMVRGASAGGLTLRCFEQIAWAYSGIPGRKTVLWLTSGFPIFQEVPDAPALFGHGPGKAGPSQTGGSHKELLPEFQRAFTAMNKANVVVYPIDVTGLPEDDMWDASLPGGLFVHPELAHLRPPILIDVAGANRDGMRELAHRTGGKSCTAGDTLAYCVDQAEAESSDYYMLGFYVPQQQRKVGWHKLKVSMAADHGEVRARTSYYLRPLGTAPQQEQEEDLRGAINASVNYTGVIFNVEPGAREDNSNGSTLHFKVSVPSSSVLLLPGAEKLSFDVIAIPLSSRSTPADKKSRLVKLDMSTEATQKALAKGWNLVDLVPINNSVVFVRVVIRDNNTGRIGSLVFPVAASGGSS